MGTKTELLDIFSKLPERKKQKVLEYAKKMKKKQIDRKAKKSREKSEKKIALMMSAAGSWKDLDTEKLLEQIYLSRKISSREVPEL